MWKQILGNLSPFFSSRTTTPGETKLLASEVYDILQSSNMSDVDNVNEMNYRRRKAQFFLGSTNKRAKTVVLHIDGLDDSVRKPSEFVQIRHAELKFVLTPETLSVSSCDIINWQQVLWIVFWSAWDMYEVLHKLSLLRTPKVDVLRQFSWWFFKKE